MQLLILAALCAAALYTCSAAGTGAYLATFQASASGGVSGTFEVKINSNGGAKYTWSIDANNFASKFSSKCSGASVTGLTYHIHSYWKNTTSGSSGLTGCSSAITGGHYDPYLACSSSSQSAAGNCTLLGRTLALGYSYSCKYSSGHYETCELGDLSGKFGNAMPASTSNLVFSGSDYDVAAPIAANYFNGTSRLSPYPWNSIVFHCPADNTRLFCADLVEQTYASDDDTSSSSSKYSDKEVMSFIVTMSIFIVLFVVLGIYYAYVCITGKKTDTPLLGGGVEQSTAQGRQSTTQGRQSTTQVN